jgi:hypothetical protein
VRETSSDFHATNGRLIGYNLRLRRRRAVPIRTDIAISGLTSGEQTMRFYFRGIAITTLTLAALASLPVAAQTNANRTDSPVVQASKAVQDAQLALTKVQADLNKLRNKVKADLLTKPEWATVNQELTKAQADMKTAQKNAMATAQNKPEYKALVAQRDEAQKVRQQSQAAATPGSDDAKVSASDLQKADNDYIAAGLSMKAMERQVLADDQAYNDAKARLDAANSKLAQLDAQVDESLKGDADYTTAQASVQTAQDAVTQAKEQLLQARQQIAQQRISEAQSRSQSHQSH